MTIAATAAHAASRGISNAHARTGAVRAIADRLAAGAISPLRPFDLWKTRLPAPQLVPLSASQAEQAAGELRTLLSCVDDGECYSRGVVGAAHLNERFGAGLTAGPNDAVRAAVAVVATSRRQTGWTFHAAPAFAAEDGSVRIVDHLLGRRAGTPSGVFSVDDWARHVGRRASDVRIQHPLDNIPTGQ